MPTIKNYLSNFVIVALIGCFGCVTQVDAQGRLNSRGGQGGNQALDDDADRGEVTWARVSEEDEQRQKSVEHIQQEWKLRFYLFDREEGQAGRCVKRYEIFSKREGDGKSSSELIRIDDLWTQETITMPAKKLAAIVKQLNTPTVQPDHPEAEEPQDIESIEQKPGSDLPRRWKKPIDQDDGWKEPGTNPDAWKEEFYCLGLSPEPATDVWRPDVRPDEGFDSNPANAFWKDYIEEDSGPTPTEWPPQDEPAQEWPPHQ